MKDKKEKRMLAYQKRGTLRINGRCSTRKKLGEKQESSTEIFGKAIETSEKQQGNTSRETTKTRREQRGKRANDERYETV